MKKILFLLLVSVGVYGQNPSKLERLRITANTKTNTAPRIALQETDGEIRWQDKELFTENSAGALSGFAITNNGNGTVNIASGTALLRATNDENGVLNKYTLSAVTNLALTDNANNFILVNYNAGTPAITVTTDPATINTTTNSLLYVVSRVGNVLNHVYAGEQNVDSNGKLRRRFLNIEPITRAQGAAISFTNRNISITSGLFYAGLTPYTTPLLGATFTNVYNNASVWTRQTAQTQINNTQYNVNGVLTTMNNGRFRVDYVYLLVNNPSQVYTVMGGNQYNNIAEARLATLPSALPVELQRLGVLVGRLIIEKDATAITEVSSAYDVRFNASTVINHNDTGAIQGGAVGDYQHVTTSEKATWNGKADLSSPSFTGTPTAPTATAGTNTTQLATTAFVTGAVATADAGNLKTTGNQSWTGQKGGSNLTTGTATVLQVINNSTVSDAVAVDFTSTSNSNSTLLSLRNQSPLGGFGLLIDNTTTSTITPMVNRVNGVTNYTLSKSGDVSATSFIKSSAPTTNLLLAGGGDIAQSTFFPAPTGLTTNFLPKWNGSAFVNSQVFDNGTNVLFGTTTDNGVDKVQVNGSGSFSGNLKLGNPQVSNQKLNVEGSIVSIDNKLQYLRMGMEGDVAVITTDWFSGSGGSARPMEFKTGGVTRFTIDQVGNIIANNTITASPATASNQVVVKSQLDAQRPYKVYTALLTQTGTNAPTAIVLENTTGETVVLSRTSVGVYIMSLTAPQNKTFVLSSPASNYIFQNIFVGAGGTAVSISTASLVGGTITPTDGLLQRTPIEIRIYP